MVVALDRGNRAEEFTRLLCSERQDLVRNYFSTHRGAWQLILLAIERAGINYLRAHPGASRNLLFLTPSELRRWPTAERVRGWAVRCASFQNISRYERVELIRRAVEIGEERLINSLLVRLPEPMRPIEVEGTRSTLLHLFAWKGLVSPLRALISDLPEASRRGHVNSTDSLGNTPLHLAAKARSHEGVLALLAFGAAVNAVGATGYTPLHAATEQFGNSKAIHILLGAGADVDLRDSQGHTSMHHAAIHSSAEDFYELCTRSRDPLVRDRDNFTPHDLFTGPLRVLAAQGAQPEVEVEGEGQELFLEPQSFSTLNFSGTQLLGLMGHEDELSRQLSFEMQTNKLDVRSLEVAIELGHHKVVNRLMLDLVVQSEGAALPFFMQSRKLVSYLEEELWRNLELADR